MEILKGKKIGIVAAALALGAVLNCTWAVIAKAWAVPVGIEFVIVSYCLLVTLISFSLAEVIGIGIISGLLTFLSNPLHAITISGGQVTLASGFSMAFFNMVSEPVGIAACFLAFGYLSGKIRAGAPFLAALLATLASGLAYLLMVYLFNPGLIAAQPGYTGMFLGKVVQVAVVNAVLVQVIFLATTVPVQKFLKDTQG
ncbi:MAG: hypothetical protein ABFC24_13175 [Methanoregulaceae archaeon]